MTARPPIISPDISQITDYLFISDWPEAGHAEEIMRLGICLVLSMHWLPPQRALRNLPITVVWLPTVDNPLLPMPMRTLRRGVEAAVPIIDQGGRVLCHCKAGVHRSVAMASCVLIAMGFAAEDAMSTIKRGRAAADPGAPHIRRRILKFAEVWGNAPEWECYPSQVQSDHGRE